MVDTAAAVYTNIYLEYLYLVAVVSGVIIYINLQHLQVTTLLASVDCGLHIYSHESISDPRIFTRVCCKQYVRRWLKNRSSFQLLSSKHLLASHTRYQILIGGIVGVE